MLLNRLPLIVLFMTISLITKAESFYNLPHNASITKAEQFILLNQVDSAKNVLVDIKDTLYTNYVDFLEKQILKENISYKDLNTFMLSINNKSEIQPILCHKFLQKQSIKSPNPKTGLNMEYVNLMSTYLTFLSDRGLMNEASEIYDQYDAYLKHFSRDTRNEKVAFFAKNVYPIMLNMARENIEDGIRLCNKNIEIAKEIDEPKYYIKAYSLKLPFIMLQGNLNEYITTCQKLIDIEDGQPTKTTQYSITLFNLLDALIYKAHSTHDLSQINTIQSLLHKAYNSPKKITKINSYNYYVQFLKLVDEDSKEAQDVFKQFNVKNIPELCDLTISESKDIFVNVELISIYGVLIRTLKYKGYFKEALELSLRSNDLIRKNYNEDLSQQIAKHEVSIAEQQKENAIQRLESKSQLYTYIFVFLFVIILIIVWAIRSQVAKNKALDRSNKEKLILLKEIHHRVKNNFQIASGLLELQFKDIEDDKITSLVQQWQARIKSMTSIHQKLYQNDILKIDLKDYITSITNDLNNLYGNDKTDIQIDIKETYEVDIDTAVNLGLILNELVTNAFKYGKKQNRLSLSITCKKHHDTYSLNVADKGEGISSSVNLEENNTLGIKLIKQLLRQLQGSFNYQYLEGASFTLQFKDSEQRILVD